MYKYAAMLMFVTSVVPAEAAIVLVTSKPEVADVSVNSVQQGKTPTKLLLEPGDHVVTVTKDGFEPFEHTVTVADKLVTIEAVLQKKQHAVNIVFANLEERGWLMLVNDQLHFEDDCTVLIPGTVYLPDGKTKMTFVKEGYRDIIVTLAVMGPSTIELDPPRKGQGSTARVMQTSILGEWIKTDTKSVISILPDGTAKVLLKQGQALSGSWKYDGSKLSLSYQRANNNGFGTVYLVFAKNELCGSEPPLNYPWRLVHKKS